MVKAAPVFVIVMLPAVVLIFSAAISLVLISMLDAANPPDTLILVFSALISITVSPASNKLPVPPESFVASINTV